jgi:GT2 family glycosyltransferase
VTLLGEKPYGELPKLVAGWDCFVVPFKRIPLTEATNPMKVYEMLATGKPVVAVDLPELRPMARDGLLSIADDAPGFAAAIERELRAARAPATDVAVAATEGGPATCPGDMPRRRQAFAARNTWNHRGEAMDRAIRGLFPLASIVVVTYNNLALNRQCLESIFAATDWPNFEVIVVDNASRDRTPDWLARQAAQEPRLRVILNAENRGYSGGNNQGLEAARGEFLCLLNNDTVVTHGWLSTLIGHLRKMPEVGLVGPVGNMVGNEAMIPVGYRSVADMPRWAAAHCRDHDGETMPMNMLGFFCVLLRREVYEKVGPLDERFGVGFFEDDDYCRRARGLGYQLRTAHDAFVHHWHGASFRLLGPTARDEIFRVNQQVFETKWAAEPARCEEPAR